MTDNNGGTDFFDNVGGGTGTPTAHLKNVGDIVHGEVVEMFKRDYIPFGKDVAEADSNEPDGKRKQLVVILQTAERNWANVVKVPKVDASDSKSPEKDPSEDDGKRAIYVPNRSNIQYAIGKAVQASGAKFEVGGTLAVRIANLRDTGKGNPLKEHEAKYEGKQDNFFGGTPTAQPQAPAQEAAPAAAPAPQAPAPAAQQDPWATPAPAAAQPQQQAPQADPWASSGQTTTQQPPF